MLIFFSDYEAATFVPAEIPREVTLMGALTEFDALSEEQGGFFGVITADSSVVQFMYDESGELLIDVPIKARGGSLQRSSASFGECRELIIAVAQGLRVESIPGLEFVSW